MTPNFKDNIPIKTMILSALLLIILWKINLLVSSSDGSGQIVTGKSYLGDKEELSKVNWIALFKDIPYAVHKCQDLSKNRTLDPSFEADFNEYQAEVKKHGPTMGNCGQDIYREVYILMQDLVKAPFIKTICETGFNAGHSSFGWLRSNPSVQVYSFDIGTNQYSKPLADHLQHKFPGRLHNIWGDSTKTLPKFHKDHPDIKCDLILIDGGHYYNVVKSDFETFRQMANKAHILIMDNYPDTRFMFMGNMWESAKRKSELFEFFQCSYGEADPEGLSFGRYAI